MGLRLVPVMASAWLPGWLVRWQRRRWEAKARETFATVITVLSADAKARKLMRKVLRMDDGRG